MITVLYVSAFVAIIQTVVFGLGTDVFTVKKFVEVCRRNVTYVLMCIQR